MRVTDVRPGMFKRQNRFLGIVAPRDTLCTAYKRRDPQEKMLMFYLQDDLKTAFQMTFNP